MYFYHNAHNNSSGNFVSNKINKFFLSLLTFNKFVFYLSGCVLFILKSRTIDFFHIKNGFSSACAKSVKINKIHKYFIFYYIFFRVFS